MPDEIPCPWKEAIACGPVTVVVDGAAALTVTYEQAPFAAFRASELGRRARRGFLTGTLRMNFHVLGHPEILYGFDSQQPYALGSLLGDCNLRAELDQYDGPVAATLHGEEVSFTAKNGPRAGSLVEYTKPVLKIVGPVAAEISR